MNTIKPFLFTALVVAATQLSLPAAEPETVWLSALDLSPITQGWGQAQADKAVTGKPMAIAGHKYEHGVGTHANSVIRLQLRRGALHFSAAVGVDDNAGNQAAAIRFKVVGDGQTLWKSEVMRLGQAAQSIDLDVKGLEMLWLLAEEGGNGISFAHADWAEAKLLVRGAKPQIVSAPLEPAVRLTPKPGPQPRINGARVFGVHPGHPLLFTIAATGDRPMSFSAEGLPPSLALDPANGQITGQIETAAAYQVRFVVSNRWGRAEQPFQIICGETLALTPHMGWNSWYVWEGHVTDQIMRDAADAMVASGMKDHGYQYVNIDDCWSVKPGAKDPSLGGEPRDAQGRINPNARFPDMKGLTDYIHSRGLKAGIYTSPGPLTCGGHAAAFGHEEADARRYAEWGFDFLKYDWCSYGSKAKGKGVPELRKPYDLMGGLLRRLDRDMILNLCQYGMGEVWNWGKDSGGHSWRTAGDLGGSFAGIPAALFRDGFDVYTRHELYRHAGPGGWNDPDYLLLGFLSNWKGGTAPTPLTPNEQYSHVSLWCLVAAPLIFSGDITRLDDFTEGLLDNDEVIEVDQDPLGKPGRRMSAAGETEVWAKDMADGSQVVGLFNRGEMPCPVTARWSDLGLTSPQRVRDLWKQQDLREPFSEQFSTNVARHGVALLRIRPTAKPNH